MASLLIAEGWNMGSMGPRGVRGWLEVGTAWAVAVVLAGVLLLATPHQDTQRPLASLWSLSPVAGGHAPRKSTDAEGPVPDEVCSDRDYVNERC